METLARVIKPHLPPRAVRVLRGVRRLLRPADGWALAQFIARRSPVGLGARLTIAARLGRMCFGAEYFHYQAQALAVIDAIVRSEGPGVVVEAGAYKGGS